MTQVRTISRAILSLLLATAFLAMSVAGGMHAISHMADHAPPGYSLGTGHAGTGDQLSFRQHEQTAPHSGENGFCFFCLHTPAVASVAVNHAPPPLAAADPDFPAYGDTPLRSHFAGFFSPRAPPLA